MAEIDATLEVGVVGGHVLQADPVVDARSWAPYGRYNVVACLEVRNLWSCLLDHAEALMPDDQVVVTGWRRAVLGGVDLLVGTVDADTENLDEHAAAVWHIARGRYRHFPQVNAVG